MDADQIVVLQASMLAAQLLIHHAWRPDLSRKCRNAGGHASLLPEKGLKSVRFVAMQHGEVLEVGRHAELLEKQGLYSSMWARQQEAASVDGAGSAATSRAASRVASTVDLQSSAETASQRPAAPKRHGHGS